MQLAVYGPSIPYGCAPLVWMLGLHSRYVIPPLWLSDPPLAKWSSFWVCGPPLSMWSFLWVCGPSWCVINGYVLFLGGSPACIYGSADSLAH